MVTAGQFYQAHDIHVRYNEVLLILLHTTFSTDYYVNILNKKLLEQIIVLLQHKIECDPRQIVEYSRKGLNYTKLQVIHQTENRAA